MDATVIAQLRDLEPRGRALSLREAAECAGIGFSTLKDLIKRGEGPKLTRPSDGRVVVLPIHFARWLDARTQP
jgi:hypothetical protein